jgi:spermidine synthase
MKPDTEHGFAPAAQPTEVIPNGAPRKGATPPVRKVSALLMVLPLFFLSGASSLIFENLWTRALVHVFGSSHFATSTVLATFMGGLALGSFLAGRWVDRVRDLRYLVGAYGVLQGAIGLYGLALPLLIGLIERFNIFVWMQWQPSFYVFSLLRFGLVGLLLLFPTTCMGATLPILSRYVCASRRELGKQAGTLYAVNTFGAVAGTFFAGFFLMPLIGMFRTNLTACSTNFLLCGAALLLARFTTHRGRQITASTERVALKTTPAALRRARIALWGIGISGAVAMVYQLVWTRTLSLILGSSVYAFTLILLCFLLGLALGGALYARRTADQPGQLANLSVIHIIIAVLVTVGLLLTDELPPTFLVLMNLFKLHPTSAFASKFLVSAALMLAPTFCMGMVFPATVKLASDAGKALGWTVGRVYAVNTVGSIVGTFIGGFILVPYLGLQFTVALMILCNVSLAVVFGAHAKTRTKWGRSGRMAGAVAAAVLLAVLYQPWNLQVMVSGVFRLSVYDLAQKKLRRQKKKRSVSYRDSAAWKHWNKLSHRRLTGLVDRATAVERLVDSELVFFREGVVTTVSVTRNIFEGVAGSSCWETVSLQVNGKADASVTGRFPRPRGRKCKVLVDEPAAFGGPVEVSGFGDTETQIMSGLLGVFLSDPARPLEWANVVGWGSGITVGSMAASPVAHVEAVELERQVIIGARWFLRYNHDAEHDEKVHLIEGDGRTYLAASGRRYDLIVSEPSNPWITGCSNLFTVEYFQLVKKHLKKSGKFVQWLQIYEISPRNVKVILATLAKVFPHLHVFRPGFSPADLLLVASRSPIDLRYDWFRSWLQKPKMKAEAARIGVTKPEHLIVRSVLDGPSLKKLVAGYPLNTDDNALVEFSAPKDLVNYARYDPAKISAALENHSRPLTALVRGGPPDLNVRLAWAWLQSGRTDQALDALKQVRPPTGAQGESARKWAAAWQVARWLKTVRLDRNYLEQIGGSTAVWSTVEPLVDRDPQASLGTALKIDALKAHPVLGLAVLGYLFARQNSSTEALRFLWAAWRAAAGPARRPAARLLGGLLKQLGLWRLALQVAVSETQGQRAAVDETGRRQQGRSSSERLTRVQ